MEHSLTATWTMLSSNGKVVLRSEDSELSITLEPEQAVTLERLLAGWPNNAHPELEPIRNELIHRGALRPLAVSPSPQQDRQIEFWRAFTDHATEAVESVGVATVALVGVGGIGSVVLQHLVGAGVSRFRLLDADIVEESNLNRQFIYSRSSVGTSKAKAAQAYIVDRIQNVDVPIRAEKWDPRSHDQQEFLLHGVDFIVAAIDRPSINSSIEVLDAAWQAGVPAILATVGLNKSLVTQVFARNLSPNAPRAALGSAKSTSARFLASHGPSNTLPAAIAADQVLHHLAGLTHRVDYAMPLILRRAPDGTPLASRVSHVRL